MFWSYAQFQGSGRLKAQAMAEKSGAFLDWNLNQVFLRMLPPRISAMPALWSLLSFGIVA